MRAGQMPARQIQYGFLTWPRIVARPPRTDCRYEVRRCHEGPTAGKQASRMVSSAAWQPSVVRLDRVRRRSALSTSDVGTYAGQAVSCWSRRMKVSLDDIPASFIRTGGLLVNRVPGTG